MKELKSIKTALEDIRLTPDEKRQGADAFHRFMANNPISVPEKPSFYERFFHFSRRFVLTSATVMGVLMLSTGGVSYAAESAVPGDLLYPVKTQITEPVRGFFRFTPESKVNWQVEQVQRRLEEAKILTEKGEIHGEFKEELNQKLESNQRQILMQIKHLRETGQHEKADQIMSNFNLIMAENKDKLRDIEFKSEAILQNPEPQELPQEQMEAEIIKEEELEVTPIEEVVIEEVVIEEVVIEEVVIEEVVIEEVVTEGEFTEELLEGIIEEEEEEEVIPSPDVVLPNSHEENLIEVSPLE